MLHDKAGACRAALRVAAAAIAVAAAAAGDCHHSAVHIIRQAQQQRGSGADRSAILLLERWCPYAGASAAAALWQVRIGRGRLLGAKRWRLQVARQQLVRLAGQRVHQAQQRPLPLLRLPCRASCVCCARCQSKGEQCAGGL